MSPEELARITDYVDGRLTPEATVAAERWIAEDSEREALVHDLRRLGATLQGTWRERLDLEGSVQRVLDRIATGDGRKVTIPSTARTRGAVPTWRRSAAGWLAAVGAVMTLVVLSRFAPSSRTTMRPSRTFATTIGQRATVTLDDGTSVTLAPQTRLVVPADFGRTTRTVQLTGEAYFNVRRSTHIPFFVRSRTMTTRVLGTAFDVTQYAGDRVARVAVVSGKVAVAPAPWNAPAVSHGELVVTGGMVARITDSTVTAAMVGDPTSYTAWTRGALTFRETPVREVLVAVGHWYGYEFQLTDTTLANRHLTAVFDNESRADVLRSLKTLLNVTMDFDGTVVTLRPQSAQRDRAPASGRRAHEDSLITLNSEVGR